MEPATGRRRKKERGSITYCVLAVFEETYLEKEDEIHSKEEDVMLVYIIMLSRRGRDAGLHYHVIKERT